jgi:hypothetical protein
MATFQELADLIYAKGEELRVLKMEKSADKEILPVIHELLFLKTKYNNKKEEIIGWIFHNYPTEKMTETMDIEDLRKCVNKLFSQATDPGDEVSNYEEEEDYHYDAYMYSKLLEYKLFLSGNQGSPNPSS